MQQIWMNREYIAKKAINITGIIYAFLGFVGTVAPTDEILPESLNIWLRVLISVIILLIIWFFCFVIIVFSLVKIKRISVIDANNGHKMYVQYGNIFDKNEVLVPNERRNIVIPVNRCFDTIVDNNIISERTIHGIAFKRLYKKNIYTEKSLNSKIQKLLNNKEYEILSENEKPAGNRKRFSVGTVIDLPADDNEHYFLWALSTFDDKLKAQTSMQDYVLAVQKLVEACNYESEGFPVVIPVVGTGLSRTKKDSMT